MEKIKKLLLCMSKADIAAIILIPAVFIYLYISAGYAGTITDEAFYISVPLRLISGDGLFTDEWHLSQLSSVLLYPAVKLFTVITGSTAGIILFIRRLFCLFQLIVGAYLYRSLRKEGIPALFISLLFMLYSVIGLRTLSYNTLGVGILFLICAAACNLLQKPSYVKMLLLGSLTAAFILCQPVGIVFYIIYFVTASVFLLWHGKDGKIPFPFTLRSLLMTVAGILPVFIFFLALLFKNSDIATIIKCIPGILSDVEHMQITDELGISTFTGIDYFTDMTMAAGIIPIIIAVVCILLALLFRKKDRFASAIIAGAGLTAFLLTFYYLLIFRGGQTETDDENFFFLPLALMGIAFYLLCEKRNHRIFVIFWCTGMLYSVFMTVSSNLRLHASVNGYIIASAATIIFAGELIKEFRAKKNASPVIKPAIISLAVSVFAFSFFQLGTFICSDILSRREYTSTMTEYGAYKGIALPSDQALMHINIYKDAQVIKERLSPDDRLFVAENLSAVYIDSKARMGAFSGWFICDQLGVPEIRQRFREYYEINPENIPSYVYVPAYVYGEYGFKAISPKIMAKNAYLLFDGEAEDIGSGLLIKVTGIKND